MRIPEPTSRCYDSCQVVGSELEPIARLPFRRFGALVKASGLGLGVALLAWASLLPTASADAPSDVGTADATVNLPLAPAGFVREQRGDVTWEFHERARAVATDLQEVHQQQWPRVVRELGVEIDSALTIRIGRSPEEMAALAPEAHPPPAYASGVAYPRLGLILLTLSAPDTWQRPDVETVLVHELSHVALHRAVGGHPVPRWFSEGVAIHQAREHSLERIRTLWSGTAAGQLISMSRLSRAFPAKPHHVNLAYAQSADFVRWLLARDDGEARFREVIERLGHGQPFETALERTYSIPLVNLELDWHDNLNERFKAWPLLFGSGTLWAFAALLIFVAYARRKQSDRKTLKRWEREEETEARAMAVATQAPPLDDDAPDPLYVTLPEPLFRESDVPTVEHEGRSYTLH